MSRNKPVFLGFVLIIPILFGSFNFEIPSFGGFFQNLGEGQNLNISAPNVTYGSLAKLLDEDSMDFDRESRELYMTINKNFSNISFKNVIDHDTEILTVGAKQDNIKGLDINNNKFVIDASFCDSYTGYCAFLINGIPTRRMFDPKKVGQDKRTSFDLDQDYKMKINSIEFNYCDGKRMCHLGFEAYTIVNISIEEKT